MTSLIQVEATQYQQGEYDSFRRFISYWHQINELRSIESKNILEIGIGNGFVSDYLRRRGLNVTTIDIDVQLRPDMVATIHALPVRDRAFDVVACYEILEHLPYQDLPQCLAEISRLVRHRLVISLPDASSVGWLDLRIGALGRIWRTRNMFTLPHLKSRIKVREPKEHYWEIGVSGYPLKRIIADLEKHTRLQMIKEYRVFHHPYHRFFVLDRK